MLSLHLEKSRAVLDGQLRFVRLRLLGQPIPRANRLVRNPKTREKLVSKAYTLAKKYVPAPVSTAPVTAVPSISPVVVPSSSPAPVVSEVKAPFAFPEVIRPQVSQPDQVQVTSVSEQAPKLRIVERSGKWRTAIFAALMILSFSVLVILFAPTLYFRFFTHEVVPVQTEQTGTPLGGTFTPPVAEQREVQLPPQEDTLPEGNWLIIPRIGVNTEILESEIPEESLIKGVWRVPEFGKPGVATEPMILAAHRFGYNWWWQGEYWKYHSFYLLPDLEPGDIVEVISDQRKYLYEIYAGEEGVEITDYNADLILYTCKFLTSDIRHFRYARRIDPSKYSDYDAKRVVAPVTATVSGQMAL